jgi:hypothetical protein
MSDTPIPDDTARSLAEQVFSAYAQQSSGPMHPQHEQTLLSRLVEAARPVIAHGSDDLARALNEALDAFEQAEPAIRGPRVAGADAATGVVRLAAG